MPFELTAKLRLEFFDAPGLARKFSSAKRKALSKAGAFVRRRAQTSIRRRKKTSPPGQPPSSHSGELRKLIFFAWDPRRESVFVGPVPLGGREQSPGAPELLEHTGDVSRELESGRKVRRHYAGNPFMSPALDAERPKFGDLFKDIL